jgi:hypothetical protein
MVNRPLILYLLFILNLTAIQEKKQKKNTKAQTSEEKEKERTPIGNLELDRRYGWTNVLWHFGF